MKVEPSVVSHFTASVDRYTEPPPEPGDFVLSAFASYSGQSPRLLELGCGTGHRLEGLARDHFGFRLFGLDITPVMVQTARRVRSAAVSFMVGDCFSTPFADGQFDAVIMYDVLHHLVSGTKDGSNLLREAGLNELVRLLALDGRIVMEEVCVNTGWRAKLIYTASHLVSRLHLSIPALHIHTDVVLNFFTLDELEAAFAGCGLQVVAREVMKFPGLGAWISTFGDTTYHVRCVLERSTPGHG
jgi:SAM-dependent methyltransferase